MLTLETTYTEVRSHLASYLDRVAEDREVVVIKRRGRGSVALISVEDLSSLMETAYLLRSPKNAERLLNALERSKSRTTESMSVEELCEELGIAKQEKAE